MVGINVQCRLGNQLFQYAFVKAASEKFDTSFYLNEKIEPFITADYFDLKGYHPLKNLINKFRLKIGSNNLFKKLQAKDINTYNEPLTNHTVYNGYFQSELFFKNIASSIPSYIQVKKVFKKKFEAKYDNLFSNNRVIAVHVRRGDYLQLDDWWANNLGGNNLSLPSGYYLNCLNAIKDIEKYQIIFVSDDIGYAREEFSHIEHSEFSDNDMITDFQIIMNADICILSNSSFAWWAAYLNPKKTKTIYCPQYWLGFKVKREYPLNIIPSNWIQMNVTLNPY